MNESFPWHHLSKGCLFKTPVRNSSTHSNEADVIEQRGDTSKQGRPRPRKANCQLDKKKKKLNSLIDLMSQSPNQIPCLPHRSQRTLEGRSISVRLQKDSHKLSSNYLKCGAHVELPPISCETYLFPRCSPDVASLRHFYRKSSLF